MSGKVDKRKGKSGELTPMQEAFCEAMPGTNFNVSESARIAGYSVKNAARMGHDLMKMPKIKKRVDAAKAKNLKRIELQGQYVLDRLVDECEADIADLFDARGKVKKASEWPKIFRTGLVSGVEVTKQGQVIIKLSDRTRRIELLGKHLNLFSDTVNLNHSFDPRGYTDDELRAIIDGRN